MEQGVHLPELVTGHAQQHVEASGLFQPRVNPGFGCVLLRIYVLGWFNGKPKDLSHL